ncbi:Uncharacterised protein [Mycobacterium tuberculosis]|nr:Uncharacterised protein [Mycobacterium tuberculosis]
MKSSRAMPSKAGAITDAGISSVKVLPTPTSDWMES